MAKRYHYRPGKKYNTKLWKLRDDRTGFPILSKDAVRDGNKPELVVHKDVWEPFLNARLPIPTITTSIPDPARPYTDPSLGNIQFCYVVTNVSGSVIGVSCSSNAFWNRTLANAAQITAYSPVVNSSTMIYYAGSGIGSVLGTVSAYDPNSYTLSYSISNVNTTADVAVDVNGFFSMNSQSGAIAVKSLAGFDYTANYSVVVNAMQTTGNSRLGASNTVNVWPVASLNYSNLITVLSPTSWFKLSETSGATIVDSSTNTNNGALLTAGHNFVYAHRQMFPNLPGMSIYENTAGFVSDINQNLSLYNFTNKLSGLIAANYVSATAGANRVLISRYGTQKSFAFYYDHPTLLGLRLSSSASNSAIAATITANMGSATNIAKFVGFTYDGANATVKLFLNGVPLTTTVTGNIPSSLNTANLTLTNLCIGCDSAHSNPFFGDLQQASLFGSVISDELMLALYQKIL